MPQNYRSREFHEKNSRESAPCIWTGAFVHQVSIPQQGPFPRGAGHTAQSKAYVNRHNDHMSPGTNVWDQKLPYQWKKKAQDTPPL